MWVANGRLRVEGSETLEAEARALLWFVSNWYGPRKPYRFSLSAELLSWLNAPEFDLGATLSQRPALTGWSPCNAAKPVSRFMYSVLSQHGRRELLNDVEGYYDFLAEFAFTILRELNAPRALLPPEIVDLLNAPADGGDLPLTVGMLLIIKRTFPDEYRQLAARGQDRILALSYHAVKVLLSTGDPRLIPPMVSSFWSQRPLPGQVVTAFRIRCLQRRVSYRHK